MLPNCNWLVRHIGLEGIHPHMQEEERKSKTLVFGLWSWLKTWTDSTSICQHWPSSITHSRVDFAAVVFANFPIAYIRDGRVGLALSPHVAEHFKSWNLIASLEKLPLQIRCYGSRWVLCQFLCLTHKSQYQRSTHTWDAFYLLLPANHLLLEIRGKIILNKFDEKLKT